MFVQLPFLIFGLAAIILGIATDRSWLVGLGGGVGGVGVAVGYFWSELKDEA
jgi:hypothetical protein